MKLKLALALALTVTLAACGEADKQPAEKPTTGGGGNGGSQVPGQTFDGILQKFHAEYVSPLSGRLRPGEYLSYKFEIWANKLPKGTVRLFECQDASCSLRAPKYKMECNFDFLTCRLLDGNGQDVRKGGLYQADAADVGELQVEGRCGRFTGGKYQKCAYLTLVDPMLKRRGFNNHYLAAEFIAEDGTKTDLKRFHISQ